MAIIALEDVGFGNPLSAALALEANRSFRFRQQLGELKSLATVVTGLADGTKSRAICDSLVIKGPEYPYPSAKEFKAHTAFHEAPWLVRYLSYRGLSHASLGYEVLPVWEMLTVKGRIQNRMQSEAGLPPIPLEPDAAVVEHKPDRYGDEMIEGLPAASWDMYVREGQQAYRYLKACPPFRAYRPAQIGMAVFLMEGSYLNRSISNAALASLERDATHADLRTVALEDDKLLTLVREHRGLLNTARRRVLG